jgi:hypothetical protein
MKALYWPSSSHTSGLHDMKALYWPSCCHKLGLAIEYLFFLMARRNKAWGIIGTHANPDRFPLVSGELYTTLLLLNQASTVAVSVFGILLLVSQIVQRVSKRTKSV